MSSNNFRQKVIKFHTLLNKTGLMHTKSDLLAGYDVTSTNDLSYDQLIELLRFLESKQTDRASVEVRKWRSVNLDLLTKLEVYEGSDSWDRVNNYLKQPKIAGKMLFNMDIMEMKKLATKLRSILKKRNAKEEQIKHQELNN